MEQHHLSSSSESSPPPFSSSSSLSMRQCRICHEEEDECCAAIESPCGCSGSLKYAHRGCVQRWCDEKGSILCEICLQNFESDYTIPPKKVHVVETAVTVSDEEMLPEEPLEDQELYAASEAQTGHGDCSSWCRSLTITFTVMLLVWHLIAVVTIEAADHCAFSLMTMYLLRAAGILLPFYAIMRMVRMIQQGQQQFRLQLLQDQRRRNAPNLHSMHGQEQQQLVISVH
ncbi:E3 ubiquitin-protein ligase MARCHF5-like [Oryza brachyantha]|uniref:RING-CH-type domain-containing protein n=1 Tax=Oryza brachyantha TaxID=4533 RepID=J3M684_ORYBR|nr:E3 ubiquitin-protein ligase MARCHF5-like [Oryza brachyantha]